jgi:hypothetical protein
VFAKALQNLKQSKHITLEIQSYISCSSHKNLRTRTGRLLTEFSSCGTCGWQSGTRTIFIWVLWISPINIIPPLLHTNSCNIWVTDNGPISCCTSTETVSLHTTITVGTRAHKKCLKCDSQSIHKCIMLSVLIHVCNNLTNNLWREDVIQQSYISDVRNHRRKCSSYMWNDSLIMLMLN